jgi:fructose-specific phosphotransferase system component IIB
MGHESSSALNYNNMPNTKPEREVKLDEQLLNAMSLYFDDLAAINPKEKDAAKANLRKDAEDKLQILQSNKEFRKMEPNERYLIVFETAKKLAEEGRINERNIDGLNELAKHLEIGLVSAVRRYLEKLKAPKEAGGKPEAIDIGKIEKPKMAEKIQTEIEYAKTVMALHELGEIGLEEKDGVKVETVGMSLGQGNIKILEDLSNHINTVLISTHKEIMADRSSYSADEFEIVKSKHKELQEFYSKAKAMLQENKDAVTNEKPSY